MSEGRLQEIKDSIELQYTLAKAKGYDNALLFTNEEEELIEEIERLNTDKEQLNSLVNFNQKEIRRLHSIIDKALELIYANAYDTERKECVDDLWGNIEELVDILKGCDKE